MNEGFTNPYKDEPSKGVSERALKLASYLSVFLLLDLTADERHAVARVADGLFAKYPWILDVPAVKKWLE